MKKSKTGARQTNTQHRYDQRPMEWLGSIILIVLIPTAIIGLITLIEWLLT